MTRWFGLIVAAVLCAPTAANAHTNTELDVWKTQWIRQAADFMTPELHNERLRMEQRHPCQLGGDCRAPVHREPTRVNAPPLAPTEIRALVEAHFPPDQVERALLVAWCESRWQPDAKNPRSSASGLFQHLRYWWSGEGMEAFDPFDPEQSVAAAYYLWSRDGWSHWNPSKGCWG